MPVTSNAFTIDVEDYFHVSAFSKAIQRSDWDSLEPHVVQNTHKILAILDKFSVKATFFVLGWVAERNKSLVHEIHTAGHEVACHGYSHKLIYTQAKEEFLRETVTAKNIIEDIVGVKLKGYRAASYSITGKSLWALDMLVECGFEYDSSIFPVLHDNYGIISSPRVPYRIETKNGMIIKEFPLSTFRILNYNLPISGGGYFRLFPYFFSKMAFRRINRHGTPFVFYMHPWEIDTTQPRIEASMLSKFRHYNNIDKFEGRMRSLLADFNFTTVEKVLAAYTDDVMVPVSSLA